MLAFDLLWMAHLMHLILHVYSRRCRTYIGVCCVLIRCVLHARARVVTQVSLMNSLLANFIESVIYLLRYNLAPILALLLCIELIHLPFDNSFRFAVNGWCPSYVLSLLNLSELSLQTYLHEPFLLLFFLVFKELLHSARWNLSWVTNIQSSIQLLHTSRLTQLWSVRLDLIRSKGALFHVFDVLMLLKNGQLFFFTL